jgi:hypothetical protein
MAPVIESHETPDYRVGSDHFNSSPVGPPHKRRRQPTGEIHAVDRNSKVLCGAEIDPDHIMESDWVIWPGDKCTRCRDEITKRR